MGYMKREGIIILKVEWMRQEGSIVQYSHWVWNNQETSWAN
jgi:hypothetical protein